MAGVQAHYGTDYGRFLECHAGLKPMYKTTSEHGQAKETVEFGDKDAETTVAYHLPMANPLDANQVYTIGTIAATNPGVRFVAMGNPSGSDWEIGGISPRYLSRLASGDYNPLLEPLHRWMDETRTDRLTHVGYSFGADLAAQAAASGEHAVGALIAIEPVVGHRRAPQLLGDFMSTEEALSMYVDAVQLKGYETARRDSISATAFTLGLLRSTNVAIALGLAKGRFPERLDQAGLVHGQALLRAVAWGSQSELTDTDKFSPDVLQWRLKEQRHALGNDIHLQAAIVTEGLTRARLQAA